MVVRAVFMAADQAAADAARYQIWNALAAAAGANYDPVNAVITGVSAADGSARPAAQLTAAHWPTAVQVPGGQWYVQSAPVAVTGAPLRPLNTTANAFRTETPIHTPGGRTYGAMYDFWDAPYDDMMTLFMQHIGAVIPGHGGSWGTVEPQDGVFDFSLFDTIYDFARRFRLRMYSPQLIVHSGLENHHFDPAVSPTWQAAALNASNWQFYTDRLIRTCMNRYPDIDDWIVANESIAEPAPGPRVWPLQQAAALPGEPYRYLAYAFQRARFYRPDANLILNDYGYEHATGTWGANKRAEMLTILDYLIAQDAAPTHVGFQCHLDPGDGYDPATIQAFGAALAARGLGAVITELDIHTRNKDTGIEYFPGTYEQEVQGASDWAETFLAEFFANFDCDVVITWGITDARTWLTGYDPANKPLPFGPAPDYPIKPMGTMLRTLLAVPQEIPARAGTTAAPGAEIPARAGTTAAPGAVIPAYPGTSP